MAARNVKVKYETIGGVWFSIVPTDHDLFMNSTALEEQFSWSTRHFWVKLLLKDGHSRRQEPWASVAASHQPWLSLNRIEMDTQEAVYVCTDKFSFTSSKGEAVKTGIRFVANSPGPYIPRSIVFTRSSFSSRGHFMRTVWIHNRKAHFLWPQQEFPLPLRPLLTDGKLR